MRILDLLHRWTGGLLGLILALLGLSGAILVHKEEWIGLPYANHARVTDPARLGELTAKLLARADGGESLIFASDRLGLVQMRDGDAGLYASQSGEVVARWSSQWERPELWLFDLHHHLFAGEKGEIVAGVAGLAAVFFVLSGTILWWRTRRTFRFRLLPARMSGPAIRMHHRDLGILFAPLLLLVALTGSMMIFPPVAGALLSPLGPPERIRADMEPPNRAFGAIAAKPDWRTMIVAAHGAFPDAQLRIVALPRKVGDPITIRMKRAEEWLPNGRTMLWFDPATGRLAAKRDALAMNPATRAFNLLYPLHAGKVGGLAYRLILTCAGIALFMLGTLAAWSFWFRSGRA